MRVLGLIITILAVFVPLCCSCCHFWKDGKRKKTTILQQAGIVFYLCICAIPLYCPICPHVLCIVLSPYVRMSFVLYYLLIYTIAHSIVDSLLPRSRHVCSRVKQSVSCVYLEVALKNFEISTTCSFLGSYWLISIIASLSACQLCPYAALVSDHKLFFKLAFAPCIVIANSSSVHVLSSVSLLCLP